MRLKLFAFKKILPALPAPDSLSDVTTDIFPLSPIVNVGTGVDPGAATVICPAFPVLSAVLNSPLPVPEIDTSSLAVRPSVPPAPAPLVLLSTRDPPVWVKLLTFSEMLPALPILEVATEIVPPLAIARVGVETVTSPAFPVLDAVLKSPLPKPENEADSVAASVTLPPCPEPLVLLTTCAPPVRLKLFAFSKILPALPAPKVSTEIFPPSAIANVGTGANAGAVTVICPALPVLAAVLNSPVP